MKWINKGHEYDDIGKELQRADLSYYIWGAGTFGEAFFMRFASVFKIIGFIDKNEMKWNTYFCGKKVISPQEFYCNYKDEIVLVSTGLTRSVYEDLEGHGFRRFKNYYHVDEVASIYEFKIHNRLFVNDIDIEITKKCSLNCKYCNAFIPLVKQKVDIELSDIKKSVEAYFKWVDEVNIFSLSGGDAMMHLHFNEILQWIGDTYYPEKIKNIEIYSNAVIIPTEETVELFKKYNIIYRFTDYHELTGKQNISKVKELLSCNDIRYDHADLESWYDSGYPQRSNGITREDDLIKFCTLCDRKSCHGLSDSKVYLCSICKSASDINYCKVEPTDYFDLSNFEEEKKIELLEYYMGYSEKGYYNYCRKCNGGMNINTHSIIQGEQI